MDSRLLHNGGVRAAEMCSGSEAGSYSRPIDFVDHSTLGLRVIKKKCERARVPDGRVQCQEGDGYLVIRADIRGVFWSAYPGARDMKVYTSSSAVSVSVYLGRPRSSSVSVYPSRPRQS